MRRSSPFSIVLALVAAVLAVSVLWVAGPAAPTLAQPSVPETTRSAATRAAPASTGPTVPHYSLDVNVDYDTAVLQVGQVTRFRNQTGLVLDRVVFQVASAHWGAFQLAAASAQDQVVAASIVGSVLEVPLPTPLPPGASAEVGLSYQLSVPRGPGRISAGAGAVGLGNWFPTLAPHRGDWDRHQYTDIGDAFVTEVADYDLRLFTSTPVVVAAGG